VSGKDLPGKFPFVTSKNPAKGGEALAYIKVLLLCLFYGGASAIQIPGMIARKEWRDLIAYSAFMFFSFAVALLMLLDIPVPNPTDLIIRLVGGFALRFMEAQSLSP
jgi:hypothetical protein